MTAKPKFSIEVAGSDWDYEEGIEHFPSRWDNTSMTKFVSTSYYDVDFFTQDRARTILGMSKAKKLKLTFEEINDAIIVALGRKHYLDEFPKGKPIMLNIYWSI